MSVDFDKQASILVIDDDEDASMVLKIILEKKNHKIDVARNGDEGYTMLKRGSYDMVISDLMMPILDGYTLCDKIRSDPEISTTPILLTTVMSEESAKIKGFEKGIDDYLIKPFSMNEIIARVSSILKRKFLSDQNAREQRERVRIKTVDETIHAISHHINNAITPIMGRAQLCRPDDKESVDSLINACREGSEKVSNFLQMLEKVVEIVKCPAFFEKIVEENISFEDLFVDLEQLQKLISEFEHLKKQLDT